MKHQHRLITCRNFKHYDKEKFIGDLKNVRWGNVYAVDSVNEAYKIFEFYVKGIVDKHDPRIKKKVRGILCPWRSLEISELMKTRYYHLRKAKKSNSEYDWYNNWKYRNKVTSSIRKSKAKYIQSLIEKNVKNPKQFWKVLKSIYSNKNAPKIHSKVFEIAGKMEYNKEKIANGFYTAFATFTVNAFCYAFSWHGCYESLVPWIPHCCRIFLLFLNLYRALLFKQCMVYRK